MIHTSSQFSPAMKPYFGEFCCPMWIFFLEPFSCLECVEASRLYTWLVGFLITPARRGNRPRPFSYRARNPQSWSRVWILYEAHQLSMGISPSFHSTTLKMWCSTNIWSGTKESLPSFLLLDYSPGRQSRTVEGIFAFILSVRSFTKTTFTASWVNRRSDQIWPSVCLAATRMCMCASEF